MWNHYTVDRGNLYHSCDSFPDQSVETVIKAANGSPKEAQLLVQTPELVIVSEGHFLTIFTKQKEF